MYICYANNEKPKKLIFRNMKKIYLLIGSVILTSVGITQNSKKDAVQGSLTKSAQEPVFATHHEEQNWERETVWVNTFSDANEWVLGNTGNHNINWQIGVGLENQGGFTTAPINSVSMEDGYAMIDSDAFQNPTTDPSDIENCWMTIAQPIDLTGHETVLINFASQYRKWDNVNNTPDIGVENCLLEISNDGVTWPDVATYDDSAAPGTRFNIWSHIGTGDEITNPSLSTFNISEVAGDQDSVYIRFRWTGIWGYSWFVDDIEIFTPELSNDISVLGTSLDNGGFLIDESNFTFSAFEAIDGDTVLGFEYYSLPSNQRPTMYASSSILNLGIGEETGIVVTGELDGVEVTETIDLASNSGETLAFYEYETTDLANGQYSLTWNAEGVSPELDENPDNNTITRSLEITDHIYARENAENLAVYPGTADPIIYKAGAWFEIFENTEIEGINFLLSDETEIGSEVVVELWAFINGETQFIDESDDFQVTNTELLNSTDGGDLTWATIEFNSPIEVLAGDLVLPVVYFEAGEGDVRILTSFTEGRDGGFRNIFEEANGDFIWRNTIHTPCVRLNFDEAAETNIVSTPEIDSKVGSLGQNIPNPAQGNTVINYTTLQSGAVSFEVFDVTGKLVYNTYEGNQPAGDFTVELDANQFNSGMYSYTLTVNGETLTKKMIIK